jgi:hypothetical protein
MARILTLIHDVEGAMEEMEGAKEKYLRATRRLQREERDMRLLHGAGKDETWDLVAGKWAPIESAPSAGAPPPSGNGDGLPPLFSEEKPTAPASAPSSTEESAAQASPHSPFPVLTEGPPLPPPPDEAPRAE